MPYRVGDLILWRVTLRLCLTDHQLAVAEDLIAATGTLTFGALATVAIDHELRRPPEPRWRQPRPRWRGGAATDHRRDVRFDAVLPAASGAALALPAGQRLRVRQLKDGQCVDLGAYTADGRGLSAARTRAIHGLDATVGMSLWSTPPHTRLLTITADSAPGHDLCFPPCSEREYFAHAGIPGHLGCAELHAAAQRGAGIGRSPVSDDVLNLWLPSAVDEIDRRLRSWPAACRRGDLVELMAETDVVVILSTCPDDLFGSSQYEPGPVRVTVSGPPSPSSPALVWPAAAPPWARARHEIAVPLPDARLGQLDRIAAAGWLGGTRAAVARALIFRLHESLAEAPPPPAATAGT
jgi:uncharacterized protein